MTTWIKQSVILSSIIVVLIALLVPVMIPHKELDWEGKFLPLAQSYADVSGGNRRPLHGKFIVVTGCTNGIGLSLTRAVVKLGATVIGIGRSQEKLQKLKEEIPSLEPVLADFSDLDTVNAAADEISSRWDHIDILVNNAGVIFPADAESAQGFDNTFSVNFLSHFLLTEKLSPVLHHNATKRPTVVQVSSLYHWAVDGTDLMMRRRETPVASRVSTNRSIAAFHSYANSKLAVIYHARALKRKHPLWSKNQAARAISVCPGWVATDISEYNSGFFSRTLFFQADWGISSLLVAMMDTSPCTDDCPDYYTNTPAVSLFKVVLGNMPSWLHSLRFPVGYVVSLLVLLTQKIGHHLGPSLSSAESYDEIIGNALYYWSYSEVSKYL